MAMSASLPPCRSRVRIRAFGGARGGNVTLTFALALIPLVGLAGSAVDYSRGNSAKAAMQAAADATALMLSKEAANLTSAQIKSKAIDYFNANFNRTDVSNVQIAPSYATIGRLADRGDRDRNHADQHSQGGRLSPT